MFLSSFGAIFAEGGFCPTQLLTLDDGDGPFRPNAIPTVPQPDPITGIGGYNMGGRRANIQKKTRPLHAAGKNPRSLCFDSHKGKVYLKPFVTRK